MNQKKTLLTVVMALLFAIDITAMNAKSNFLITILLLIDKY